jgi:hypothetical protein
MSNTDTFLYKHTPSAEEDLVLARTIVERLNALMEDDSTRKIFQDAFHRYIVVEDVDYSEHPTLRTTPILDGEQGVGVLGILCGIAGLDPETGKGNIVAAVDPDDGNKLQFFVVRTDVIAQRADSAEGLVREAGRKIAAALRKSN